MISKSVFFILCTLPAINGNGQVVNTSVDSVIYKAAAAIMDSPVHAGLSIGFIKDGRSNTYHFGTTERGKEQTPADQTIYEIGSITKTMTGTLLAHAVIDKKVSLDDDVRKYIEGDYPNLEYQRHPIRLSHLLNHSSGLPHMLPDRPELFQDPDYNSLPFTLSAIEMKYTRQQFFEDLKKVMLDTIPGIKLNYSNAAAQLLGYILEKVYSMPYEALVIKYIAKPLGMNNTKLTLRESDLRHLAKGYNGNGHLMPYNHSGAAGGIYSTITDMLKYAKFQMNEENAVVRLSHIPTWGNIQYYASGLNWQMQHRANEPYRIFQSGGTAGFSSFIVVYPELNIGIVLLYNVSDQETQGKLSQAAEKIFNSLAGNVKY